MIGKLTDEEINEFDIFYELGNDLKTLFREA